VDRFFESPDLSAFPPLTAEMVEDVLSAGGHIVSELLMLYFACVTSDPDEHDFADAPQRIIQEISDLADDGDEDAMMAMVALDTLELENATEEATIVGAAMLQLVASRPILRDVISGDLDFEAAAAPLTVIKMLTDHLLVDVLDPEGLDDLDDLDVDLDDIDFNQLAAELGLSEFDLDLDDGAPNDR